MDGNIANFLGLARTAASAGNNEEAALYYNRILEIDPTISEAWMGKGRAAGWQSSLAHIRLPEMRVAFNHAIATANHDMRSEVAEKAANAINEIVSTLYVMSRDHLMQFVTLQSSWADHVQRVAQMLESLEDANSWDPSNRTALENIIHLCKDNLEGVSYRDSLDQNLPKAWALSDQYESLLQMKMDAAIEKLKSLDPNYAPPIIDKKEAENCFIVTATMGDLHHPVVRDLQRFRDDWLHRYRAGVLFTKLYYKIGPVAAKCIRKSPLAKLVAFALVVRPAHFAALLLLKKHEQVHNGQGRA